MKRIPLYLLPFNLRPKYILDRPSLHGALHKTVCKVVQISGSTGAVQTSQNLFIFVTRDSVTRLPVTGATVKVTDTNTLATGVGITDSVEGVTAISVSSPANIPALIQVTASGYQPYSITQTINANDFNTITVPKLNRVMGADPGPWSFAHPPLSMDVVQNVTDVSYGDNTTQAWGWTLPALAGLVARTTPQLTVNGGTWLATAKSLGLVSQVVNITALQALAMFPVQKYVLFTSGNTVQAHCAVTIAGVNGSLPVGTADLQAFLSAVPSATLDVDLTVPALKTTLAAGFPNNAAYTWLWSNYGSKVSKSLISMNAHGANDLVDYTTFMGAFFFDYISDSTLYTQILKAYPTTGVPVIGFWEIPGTTTGGFGLSESATVSLLSPYNMLMNAAGSSPNTTYYSGMTSFTGARQAATPTITYNANTHYVAFIYSQGDAWGYNNGRENQLGANFYDVEQFAAYPVPCTFPLAITMRTMQPEVMAAYYAAQTPNMDFIAGGLGYVHPSQQTGGFEATYFAAEQVQAAKMGINSYFIIDSGFSNALVLGHYKSFPSPPTSLWYWNLGPKAPAGIASTATTKIPGVPVPVFQNGVAVDNNGFTSAADVVTGIKASAALNPHFIYVIINTPPNSANVQQRNSQVMTSLGSTYKAVTASQLIQLVKDSGL